MSWSYFFRSPWGVLLPITLIGLGASWLIPHCSRREAQPPSTSLRPSVSPTVATPPVPAHSPSRPALVPVESSSSFPRSPLADGLNTPGTTAQDDLRAIARILTLYRERFDTYPAFETNAHLVNALAGANPHRIALLPRDAAAIAPATGELLDRWGTPYDVHSLSRDAVQLRSAGPDRVRFTDDDLTLPLGSAAAP